MKLNKTFIISFLLVIGVVSYGAYKLKDNQNVVQSKVKANDPSKEYMVKSYLVTESAFTEHINAIGTFESAREVQLVSQANGQVKYLNFELGSQVKAGQVLVRVDQDILQAQYNAAVANYENAKSNLERYEKAAKSDGIPQIQIDQASLAVKSAESQMKVLAKQLQNTTITAPFDGVVTEKNVELGSTLSPGGRVLTITDISSLKLTVKVPEKDVVQFKTGQHIDIASDLYPGKLLNGKIVMIGAKGDKAHNYSVQIEVKNDTDMPLKAGMYGSVASSASNSALLVPKTALVGSEKDAQVYVIEDGKAVLRSIRIASSNNEFYSVSSGLKKGDAVVVSGQINLDDATPVSIAQ